jgi:hypothetical protein
MREQLHDFSLVYSYEDGLHRFSMVANTQEGSLIKKRYYRGILDI